MEIKKLEKKDIHECALELMQAFKGEPWNEDWTYEQAYLRIEQIMANPFARGYIICDQDKVVAMSCGRIMTYLDSQEFWIDEFSVDPSYQGQHLGQKLMDHIKEEMKKEEIESLVLITCRHFPCESFYKKQGYQIKEQDILMYCDL